MTGHRSAASLLVLLLASLVAACSEDPAPQPAAESLDLLLVNARVYTLDWAEAAPDGAPQSGAPYDDDGWQPDAAAVGVRDGRIVFVGTNDDAAARRQTAARVVDLEGATVVPGLIDSHTHVFELGKLISRVSLVDAATEEDAVARIAARANEVPAGEWIIGYGWDEGAWANRYPDKALLSAAVPDHPVLMQGLHGFADWCNQKALDVAGITAETPVPVGGEMRMGDDGEPNGLFINRGTQLIRAALPEPSDEDLERQLLLGLERMAEDGYVTVHDAGLGSREMAVLEALERDRRLPIRVYAMLSLRDEPLVRRWIQKGPDRDADSMLVTRSVKAYYDGALGSRGAKLLYDYSDMPGHRGISGDEYGFDEALMADAMRAGFQIAIHAIGDAGNREAIDILEAIMSVWPATAELRHRIEHAQVLHPDDLPRLGELGLIASMEPPHAMEDKTWAEDRLGSERILGAYAWRSLRESGARLTFNSDNPGSDHDIFYGLHSAVTRQDKEGEPEGGWYAHEAVTMEEALRGYTDWSAFASFREDVTGIIAPGRWADLTVLDVDPFLLAETDPYALFDGDVVMTIVGGDVAYER